MSTAVQKSMSYLISAYIVLSLFLVATVILLCIIGHLIYVSHKNRRSHSDALQTFIAISVAGIVSFTISCILVIAVIVQIILLDGHHLHIQTHWFDTIYYQSFDAMEYLIAIFDTIGHLCVVVLFIGRFIFTFSNGIFLNYSNRLIRCLYFILFALCLCSSIIIVLIIKYHKSKLIIGCEIVWQLSVEAMCLWLLHLFTSRLYLLLKLSLTDHIKSGKATDFFKDLLRAVKHNISTTARKNPSQSKESSRSAGIQLSKGATSVERKTHMTIDGVAIEPIHSTLHLKVPSSTPGTDDNNNSLEISNISNISLRLSPHSPVESVDLSIENELIQVSVTKGKERKLALASEICSSETNKTEVRHDLNEAVSLIVIMNKLTLLVVLMVLVSIVGVFGNVFIEIRELETIGKHEVALQSILAEILPLIDAIITSLVLYLQFNFTDKTYRLLLGKLDTLFLKCWLKILIQCWWRENKHNDEKVMSFLFDNAIAKRAKKGLNNMKNPKESPSIS